MAEIALDRIQLPQQPIEYDNQGFAKNASMSYLTHEGLELRGIPLMLKSPQFTTPFQKNEHGKYRAKMLVDKESANVLKSIHAKVTEQAKSLFGESTKVSMPVWDETITVGYPLLKKAPGLVTIRHGDEVRESTFDQVIRYLAPRTNLDAVELTMNIWARHDEEAGQVRVGYYFTLDEIYDH